MKHLLKSTLLLLTFSILTAASPQELLEKSKKILILGDSITQKGHYVVDFDTWLVQQYPKKRFTVINAGVASETISGLGSPNHAGGKFPRPVIFERLERVLNKVKPDLIIACYGMNCGVYKPLDPARFARYKNGILRLRAAAAQYNAELVHVTPPIYDNHGKPGFNYDTVLIAYSAWLVDQRKNGWHVADLHSAMRKKVDILKSKNPNFTFQKDKIHPDEDGHWLMAETLIQYFTPNGASSVKSRNDLLTPQKRSLINQRSRAYQKAIHAETKPLRPGVPSGGTLELAEELAKKLEPTIYGSK